MDISFFELVSALKHVYNISYPLGFFLTSVAFCVSGTVTFSSKRNMSASSDSMFSWARRSVPVPHWSLNLASLAERGDWKIAHDGSMVHPNAVPSHAPDRNLLNVFLAFASRRQGSCHPPGLSLVDLARYHEKRVKELPCPLSKFHEKIALGECALSWAVMRRHTLAERRSGDNSDEHEEIITEDVLKTWFGAERLPEDWWSEGGSRPIEPIGMREVRRRADDVAKWIGK